MLIPDFKNKVDYCLVIDRSGSMNNMKEAVESGFEEQLDELKDIPNLRVSVMQFWTELELHEENGFRHHPQSENRFEWVCEEDPVSEAEGFEFSPGGRTPLNDAIGKAIERFDGRDDVVIVIFTDGLENNSEDYGKSEIEELIEQKEEDGWKIEMQGTDEIQDFVNSYNATTTTTVSNDSSGMKQAYASSTRTVTAYVSPNSGEDESS